MIIRRHCTYHIYILECADHSYYISVTCDAEGRYTQHQEGLDPLCYTFTRRPVQLVYVEEFTSILDAIAREKQLKGWSRAKKKALIEGQVGRLQNLAKNRDHVPGRPSTGSG